VLGLLPHWLTALDQLEKIGIPASPVECCPETPLKVGLVRPWRIRPGAANNIYLSYLLICARTRVFFLQEEFTNLKSQFVISSWGGMRRSTPYAFTEQGVAMIPIDNNGQLPIYPMKFLPR
jgi:hypothetical protein